MEEPVERGLPFELYDIWRKSILTPNLYGDSAVFSPLEFDLPEIDQVVDRESQLVALEPLGGFDIKHGAQRLESTFTIEEVSLLDHQPDFKPQDFLNPDVWNLKSTIEEREHLPQLWTWEGFSSSSPSPAEHLVYISEAGAVVFHALLTQKRSKDVQRKALPQHVALKALVSLAVGRSSAFFRWNEEQSSFESTLQDAPFVDLSHDCTQSLIESVKQCGMAYKLLERFALGSSARLPAVSALMRCTSLVLECVDEHVTSSIGHIQTLLQLQAMLKMPAQLLMLLQRLVTRLRICSTDCELMNSFVEHLKDTQEANSTLRTFFERLFERVSGPWLHRMLHSIQLMPPQFGTTLNLPGDTPVVLDSSMVTIQHDEKMPDFVDSESERLIKETTNALESLTGLVDGNALSVALPKYIQAVSVSAVNVDALLTKLKEHEAEIKTALKSLHLADDDTSPIQVGVEYHDNQEDVFRWTALRQQDAYVELQANQMAALPRGNPKSAEQTFKKATVAALRRHMGDEEFLSLKPPSMTSPLNLLQPLLETQWRLSNGILLRHILRTCKLRHHLQLQRDYCCFGNGDFVTRLSDALFSQELQSAERRSGNIPKGNAMGLRLGSSMGRRWPPASSELQLTLMGILSQMYHRVDAQYLSRQDKTELPGGLSFAIRELPDAEIDKVMDPRSTYALDFLRLHYTAPPPLHTILTSTATQRYDDVFRYLLRLLRALHVTTTLRRSMFARRHTSRTAHRSCTFTSQAHHFVTTMLAHSMEIGIEAPWQQLSSKMADIEASLASEDDSGEMGTTTKIGLESLKQLHESYLESVRSGLYLKRKQEQIRATIENLLSTVLRCASSMDTTRALPATDFAAFTASVQTFLRLLQNVASQPPKSSLSTAVGERKDLEIEQAKILLNSLNWNRFYGDTNELYAM